MTFFWRSIICQHRKSTPMRLIAEKCRSFLALYENVDWDFSTNGEIRVLECLSNHGFSCIFDVGANHGHWTLAASKIFKDAEIHAFEIVPDTARMLREKVSNLPNVFANEFGLHEDEQEVEVYWDVDRSTISTTLENTSLKTDSRLLCRVISGDSYMLDQGIQRINLLKIDVEGAEDKVLKGFSQTLIQGNIDIIQFEYSRRNILSHFLLYDFYMLLKQYNYTIGKIYPNYVDFREYSLWDENFYLSNFLAVRTELTQIIDRLS
jgi:FkbM family methyltransferase